MSKESKSSNKSSNKNSKMSAQGGSALGGNIRPLGDRVLVKREDDADKKSPSGIIIPDTAQKEKSKRGIVVAVGPGKYGDEGDLIPMTVKVGAKVYFNAGWDNEIPEGGKEDEYFLVHESDILAVIK